MRKFFALIWGLVSFFSCMSPSLNAQAQENLSYKGEMGFTPWPYDLTDEAVEKTYDFIHKNATMISHHLDGGVPWEAALNGTEFPKHLREDWNRRLSHTAGMKIFLSITPVNFSRDGLAADWTEKGDNQPLPPAWSKRSFNDPQAIQAYTNYILRAVEYFKPDYLAIGIEANVIISKAPQKWPAYLEMNRRVYEAVKKKYPNLPVFSTVQYEHMRGIEGESKENVKDQKPGVADLMKHSDFLALSTYKYGFIHPNKITDDYFNEALSFGKPIAIAEMGAMSQTTFVMGMPLMASKKNQKEFIEMILSQAAKHKFVFVINWVPIDFDEMLGKIPSEFASIAKAWVHTGLLDEDFDAKPAYEVWTSYLKQKRRNK
ncbi:MAG: hypothetical protein KDI13_02420 [Alphaproteobacteria bacterium]|nr:hypothetical protein [Alphaproteobacteria bacterium]